MADGRVLLEVVVEGKNVKVVQRQVEGVTDAVNENTAAQTRNSKAADRTAQSTERVSKANDHFSRGLKGSAGVSSNATKNFSKMRDAMDGSSGLVGAYATLAANLFAATAAFTALQKAAQVEQLEKGLMAMGQASGVAMGALSAGLQKATGFGISLQDSMRSVALITSAGFDSSAVEKLGEVARSTSIALGRDTADSLDRLVRGAVKLEPELLDELGIMVRLDEASEAYALKLGKTVSQLSNFEKRQGFLNAVLEEGNSKFGDIGDNVETNPYDQLAASLTEVSKVFLNVVNVGLKPFISFLAENQLALSGFILILSKGVLNQAIPIFSQLAEKARELAGVQNLAAKKADAAAAKEIANKKEQLNVSTKILGAFGKEYNALTKSAKSTEDYRNLLNKVTDSIRRRELAIENGRVKNLEAAQERISLLQKEKEKIQQIIALEERRVSTRGIAGPGAAAAAAGAESRLASRRARIFESLDNVPTLDNYIFQLKRANIAGRRYRQQMEGMEAATVGFLGRIPLLGAALGRTNVILRSFSTAAGIAAKGLFLAIPIVGQIIFAIDLLRRGFTALTDLFKTDQTKALEEKFAAAADTSKELASSFEQVDRYLSNQNSTVRDSAQLYEILGNSTGQLLSKYKELKAFGAGEEERAEFLEKSISSSKKLTQELQKQFGVSKLSLIEEGKRAQAGEKVLEVTNENAVAATGVVSAAKAVSEELGKFRTANQITTPYTQLSKALNDLEANIEDAKNKGIEDVSLFLTQINAADARFFNLEAERSVLIQIKAEAEKLRDDLAKGENAASFSGFITSLFGTESMRRENQAAIDAAGVAANQLSANQERERKAAEDAQKKIAAAAERTRIDNLNAATQQSTLAGLEAEVALQKEINSTTQTGVAARIAAEEKLRTKRIEYNNDSLARLRIEEASEKDATTKASITARIGELEAQNNLLAAQNLTIQEKSVEFSKASVEAVNEEQKYLKAILDLNTRISQATESRVKNQIELQRTTLETARAVAASELSPRDSLRLAQQESAAAVDAANTAYNLKVQSIDLEYALLDAQFALLRAELEVAKQSGVITQQSYSSIISGLNNIDLPQARQAEVDAAESQRAVDVAKAMSQETIARANAERQTTQDRIDFLRLEADFAETSGNARDARIKREQALSLEILQIQKDINYLKNNGLDTVQKEKELSQKILEQQKESANLSIKSAVSVQQVFGNISEIFYQDIKNTVPLVNQLATSFASAVDAAADSFVDAIIEGKNIFKAIGSALKDSLRETLAEAAKSQLKLGLKIAFDSIPGLDILKTSEDRVATSAESIAGSTRSIADSLSNLSCTCAETAGSMINQTPTDYSTVGGFSPVEPKTAEDPFLSLQKKNYKILEQTGQNTSENVNATKGVGGEVGFWGRAQQYATENVGTVAAAGFASIVTAIAAGRSTKSSILGGILGIAGTVVGGMFGGPTGAFVGGQIGGMVGARAGFAKGGVMSSSGPMPLQRYSKGGIADRAQIAVFGEGSKPEAYVPLPDGRSIPVTMSSSGGNVNNISVSVSVDNKGNATTETSGANSEEAARSMGVAISNAVKQEIFNQQRPGGLLWKGRR